MLTANTHQHGAGKIYVIDVNQSGHISKESRETNEQSDAGNDQ
jgi:nitrogen regulatory protein PII